MSANNPQPHGWEYQGGGWFRQKGIEKGKTAPVIHAPELVEQLTAELTAERQRHERELASEIDLKQGTYRILQREKEQLCIQLDTEHQQLLSALAAIARHNNAPLPDCPWGKIDVDLSQLHKYRAEACKPLVELLIRARPELTHYPVLQTDITDALAKVKVKE